MEVERQRVGSLDSGDERLEFGRERGQRAECAVDVEPQLFAHREIGECRERVDRAGSNGAGVSDDEERARAGGAIGGDRRAERGDVDAIGSVDGDRP